MGRWVNYNPKEEITRAKVDRAISAWVSSLKERGIINGELAEQDELVDFIVSELEPEEGENGKN